MLLATTNLMSQEIAVVPFLWALPLAIYLFSFVLTFDSPKWYRREIFQPLFVIAALVTTYVVLARRDVGIMNQINAYTLALFATSPGKLSLSHIVVDGIYRGCHNPDQNLITLRFRFRCVLIFQNFRAAILMNHDRLHYRCR